MVTRDHIPVTLAAVAAELVAACVVYAGVFVFFAISTEQRHFYLSKAAELIQRRASGHPVSEGA
jgi:hypothetical protein